MTNENYNDCAAIANLETTGAFSTHPISRRIALRTAVLGGVGLAAVGLSSTQAASPQPAKYSPLKGRINHSVARWTFGKLSLDELCQAAKQIGFSAIDGVRPEDWPTLKAHGVHCSMCMRTGPLNWADGFAALQSQDETVASFLRHIDLVADAGFRNLVCYSGNRRGMSEEEAMTNVEVGLKRILGHAEKRGVVLAMGMWNSKVGEGHIGSHPDYLCDNPAWGVALCKRLGSPNFGLIYNIYHMQLMEGNIISAIREHHEHFVHYQTAGVPGRHEIGKDQEVNYPAVCRAIVETGFDGYLAHEFFPVAPDPVASLREAVHICDV